MDDAGGLVRRLEELASVMIDAFDFEYAWKTLPGRGNLRVQESLREAAGRIEALERALADQLAICPGCGGYGREPDTGATCRRCGEARAVLDKEGGQGDG